MQKLSKRNTYTPTDTPLVRSNCGSVLNSSEGRNGVQILKTFDNSSEEDHREHSSGSDLRVQNIVYVLSMRGKPLMPTNQSKARRLLKCKKAKVVKRFPFTIQMTIPTGETKQDITLGVDSGYKNIGLSAISESKELFSSEVKLRTNIVKLISQKSMYRRTRRNKLWYRKPRFLNRGIKKGWLAPSIQHKFDSHIKIVKNICNILPVTKIIVETASFDIQKIKNPDIQGKEYQEGDQKGFNNVKAYVLHRDGYKCQHCNKKNLKLQVHHIVSRKTGGDRPDNLITLCEECHDKFHKGEIEVKTKKTKGFKEEAFMTIVRHRIIENLRDSYISTVKETFGYLTKEKRFNLHLEKSHVNDAFCIADGNLQKRSFVYNILQKRKNSRRLQINRKGFKPSIRRQRYPIQPHDIVKIEGKEYVTKGTHCKGKAIIITKNNKKRSVLVEKIENIFHVGTFVYLSRISIFILFIFFFASLAEAEESRLAVLEIPKYGMKGFTLAKNQVQRGLHWTDRGIDGLKRIAQYSRKDELEELMPLIAEIEEELRNRKPGKATYTDDLVRDLKPLTDFVHKHTGIPSEVILSQIALESGWGGSNVTVLNSNILGLLGGRGKKKDEEFTVRVKLGEHEKEIRVRTYRKTRAYAFESIGDCIFYYVYILLQSSSNETHYRELRKFVRENKDKEDQFSDFYKARVVRLISDGYHPNSDWYRKKLNIVVMKVRVICRNNEREERIL